MTELDDTKLKDEIDEITRRIEEILKKIESTAPARQKPAEQNED